MMSYACSGETTMSFFVNEYDLDSSFPFFVSFFKGGVP